MYFLVDDNWVALDGWIEILEFAGETAHRTSDVLRSIETFRQMADQIECAILDVAMPAPPAWGVQGGKRTGIYLADRLREIKPDLPIIFLTAQGDAAVLSDLDKYIGARRLRKDVDPETFPQLLRRLIAECKGAFGKAQSDPSEAAKAAQ